MENSQKTRNDSFLTGFVIVHCDQVVIVVSICSNPLEVISSLVLKLWRTGHWQANLKDNYLSLAYFLFSSIGSSIKYIFAFYNP